MARKKNSERSTTKKTPAKRAGVSSKVRPDNVGRVKVLFLRDYVASRGAGISGREGDEKWFPSSNDLAALTKDIDGNGAVLEIIKKGSASSREKAVE